MMRKLRTLLTALLLVPVLSWNAHAFTTDSDSAVTTSRSQSSGWCVVYWNGAWYYVPC
jgi:hypothetical protein